MKTNHRPQKIILTLLILCGISLSLSIFGFYSYWEQERQRLQAAKNQARREAMLITLEIENELRSLQDAALPLVNLLTAGEIQNQQLLVEIEEKIQQSPYITAFGAAYEPGVTSETQKLYAPAYIRVNNNLQLVQRAETDDYMQGEYAWYRKALAGGTFWGESYSWSEQSVIKEPVVGLYAPFYRMEGKEKQPQGVLFAEYSLSQIKQMIDSLKLELGKTGYAFIISKKGDFIYHTIAENTSRRNNIIEVATKQNNKELLGFVKQALEGQEVEGEFINKNLGEDSWFFFQPIKLNGWAIGVVFLKKAVLLDDQTKRQTLILSCLALVWFFIFLSILLLRTYEFRTSSLWMTTSIASVLFLAEIALVWRLALGDRNYLSNPNILLNQAQVDRILAPQFEVSKQLNQEPPLYLPTGIFVKSIEFQGAKKIFITGYIWQKYTKGVHDGVTRGFILADALDANDLEMREAYRNTEGNVETIGWYVEATLYQNFDYYHYPFEHKNIQIRLWPSTFNDQAKLNRLIVITPDFESYNIMNPTTYPGLDLKLLLDGWELEHSFFEYQYGTYTTNFGIGNTAITTEIPELLFTVVAKREVISPFISRIGPLFIIMVMVFAMLMIADRDKALEVLAACAGFIFVVILDQVSLREQILAKGLVYFEFFYLVIYLYIFSITVNAVLLLVKPDFKLLQYQNNLIAKVFYWPSLLKLLLLITIFVFY